MTAIFELMTVESQFMSVFKNPANQNPANPKENVRIQSYCKTNLKDLWSSSSICSSSSAQQVEFDRSQFIHFIDCHTCQTLTSLSMVSAMSNGDDEDDKAWFRPHDRPIINGDSPTESDPQCSSKTLIAIPLDLYLPPFYLSLEMQIQWSPSRYHVQWKETTTDDSSQEHRESSIPFHSFLDFPVVLYLTTPHIWSCL